MESDPKENLLNVVDENGNVVGEETRYVIHQKGLLHQEVSVWFYTPKGEIIFQHRAKNKETFPDLLDATVGGHVEMGSNYLQAALEETEEETGLKVGPNDLKFLGVVAQRAIDEATSRINNTLRGVYAYCYSGSQQDLQIEKGAAVGFEFWPIDKLFNLNDEEEKKFIPSMIEPKNLEIFKKIDLLMGK